MLTLNLGASALQAPSTIRPEFSFHFNCFPPLSTVKFSLRNHASPKTSFLVVKAKRSQDMSAQNLDIEMDEEDNDSEEYEKGSGYRGREEEKNYDKDPEFAEILGSCLDDPQKAQSKVSKNSSHFINCFADILWV